MTILRSACNKSGLNIYQQFNLLNSYMKSQITRRVTGINHTYCNSTALILKDLVTNRGLVKCKVLQPLIWNKKFVATFLRSNFDTRIKEQRKWTKQPHSNNNKATKWKGVSINLVHFEKRESYIIISIFISHK